jgi:hypothetical protein
LQEIFLLIFLHILIRKIDKTEYLNKKIKKKKKIEIKIENKKKFEKKNAKRSLSK